MTVQNSVTVRNAMLDAWETAIGTTPKLQIRTGSQPANCAASASGTLLCEMDLPSDWMNAASSGSKTKLGTWTDVGVAAGSAGHYRILDSTGATCHDAGGDGHGRSAGGIQHDVRQCDGQRDADGGQRNRTGRGGFVGTAGW